MKKHFDLAQRRILVSFSVERCGKGPAYRLSRLNARMHGYLSINTKNPPTVDFGNLIA